VKTAQLTNDLLDAAERNEVLAAENTTLKVIARDLCDDNKQPTVADQQSTGRVTRRACDVDFVAGTDILLRMLARNIG